jgi:hypothetical protein
MKDYIYIVNHYDIALLTIYINITYTQHILNHDNVMKQSNSKHKHVQ